MKITARQCLIAAACGLLLAVGCGGEDSKTASGDAENARSGASGGERIAARGFEASAPHRWVRRDDLLNELELPPYGSHVAIIAPDGPGTVETYIQIYENNEAGGYEAASALFGGSRGLRERACRQTGEAIGGNGAETSLLPVSRRPDDTVIAGCMVRPNTGSLQYRYTVLKSPVVYDVVGESQATDPERVLKRPLAQLIESIRIP
jgi:hypothetical protein